MDFLDPRKKRAHRQRLMFGYVLLAIAIMLGTVILVYGAYGYSLNPKTGSVVENGLLFVDSKPGGAEIYLNNKDIGEATSARKVLPAGNYRLRLSKDGYRDWSRSFTLEEHSVARYVYPFLFPSKPQPANLKKYTIQPNLITTSPDRHWLLVFNAEGSSEVLDQFDTTNLKTASQVLALPAGVLTNPAPASTYKLVEWSTDNKHVIVQRSFAGGMEFIMVDREKPAESYNINKRFALSPDKVALRDKKPDQLYIHTPDGQLRLGTAETGQLAPALLKDVADFKPYGSDLVLYVAKTTPNVGQATAAIWQDGRTYSLWKLPLSDKYLIDVAKFQDDFYYVVGASTGNAVSLFKNPMNSLKDTSVAKASPMITMRISGSQQVSFSANTRFIEAEAGQNFAVYDLEEAQYYKYVLTTPLTAATRWMDGHRLVGSSEGQVFVMDYDKANQQNLLATTWAEGALFDRNYDVMFTTSASNSGGFELVSVDMRAGKDLPSAN